MARSADGLTANTVFVIPYGTIIPARGHFLAVNNGANGYSLSSHPAGAGTTATGDLAYTTDIADNVGIALFKTANPANFTLANRLDAVGSTLEASTLYREGAGYTPLTTNLTLLAQHSFYRDLCGYAGGCATGGLPKDTGDNAADFLFVDTNATQAGAGQRLGAPGPENLSSPIQRNAALPLLSLDATVAASQPPNRVRDFTSDPPNNSAFGTLDLRRRVTNNTGAAVTRLRIRVASITTFPAPPGVADIRARTSTAVSVGGINDVATCAASGTPATPPCAVTVQGTVLEQQPSQPNGGGYNSALSVTLPQPLAAGASVNVRLLLGIQQTGAFHFFVNIEALP